MQVIPEMATLPQEPEEPKSDIVFFLGAGASVKAGVPTTFDFVNEFKLHLNKHDKKAVETVARIELILIEWQRSNGKDDKVDIELLMQTLDKLKNRNEEQILEFCKDKTNILGEYSEKGPILKELQDFIKQRAIVQKDRIKYLEPLRGFIQKYRSLDIFSVNYDTCIELFCVLYQHSYRDGFEVEWNPQVFDSPNIDIRLYKLHGSVTWYKASGGGFVKSMIKHPNEEIELVTGEKAEALMLYPIHKWEYAEPLLENLLNLKNKLQSPDSQYVIVIGYSFRDDYIRDIFWDSANKNKELTLVLVDPSAFKIYQDRLEYFDTKEKIPSSLKDRVVCLPFRFEKVFPSLQNEYINNIKKGISKYRTASQNELLGTIYPNWPDCLKPMADGGYTDKVDEIMRTKLIPIDKHTYKSRLAHRANYMNILDSRFEDIRSLQEIFFKQCIHLFSCGRKTEAEDALLDLSALMYLIFVRRLDVDIGGDRVNLKPNTVNKQGKYPEIPRYLRDLYWSFSLYSERFYFEHGKVEKIKDLVAALTVYLDEWGDGGMIISQYIQLRRNGIIHTTNPELVNELSDLYARYEKNTSTKPTLAKDIAETILKIERGIVTQILSKYNKL